MRTDLKLKCLYPHVLFIITSVEKLIFTNIRAFCCGESWNIHGHDDDDSFGHLELVGCFCYHYDACAEYHVTSSKFLTPITGG